MQYGALAYTRRSSCSYLVATQSKRQQKKKYKANEQPKNPMNILKQEQPKVQQAET